ncbi:MAG TPA: twin-arginine translocase TatA/TatE family subunit [Nitrososphaeraceae archaeon]|jgi:sec-independent protein translocase protein TatA
MIGIFHSFILQFAGLGGAEWIIVAAIIIALIFGVKKIPELARSFGRASGEFQKAKIEMHNEIERVKHTDTSTRSKLESVAEKLGIDSSNKSDEELRLEIDKNLSKNTK